MGEYQDWSYGVMVSTLDSESNNPSSNLGRTFFDSVGHLVAPAHGARPVDLQPLHDAVRVVQVPALQLLHWLVVVVLHAADCADFFLLRHLLFLPEQCGLQLADFVLWHSIYTAPLIG